MHNLASASSSWEIRKEFCGKILERISDEVEIRDWPSEFSRFFSGIREDLVQEIVLRTYKGTRE